MKAAAQAAAADARWAAHSAAQHAHDQQPDGDAIDPSHPPPCDRCQGRMFLDDDPTNRGVQLYCLNCGSRRNVAPLHPLPLLTQTTRWTK